MLGVARVEVVEGAGVEEEALVGQDQIDLLEVEDSVEERTDLLEAVDSVEVQTDLLEAEDSVEVLRVAIDHRGVAEGTMVEPAGSATVATARKVRPLASITRRSSLAWAPSEPVSVNHDAVKGTLKDILTMYNGHSLTRTCMFVL